MILASITGNYQIQVKMYGPGTEVVPVWCTGKRYIMCGVGKGLEGQHGGGTGKKVRATVRFPVCNPSRKR